MSFWLWMFVQYRFTVVTNNILKLFVVCCILPCSFFTMQFGFLLFLLVGSKVCWSCFSYFCFINSFCNYYYFLSSTGCGFGLFFSKLLSLIINTYFLFWIIFFQFIFFIYYIPTSISPYSSSLNPPIPHPLLHWNQEDGRLPTDINQACHIKLQ